MGKIFISYRHLDWPFAQLVAMGLELHLNNGDVFFDVRETPTEADFQSVILREVADATVFILIVTPNTFDTERLNRSDDWIRREVALALTMDKPIALACFELNTPPHQSMLPDEMHRITTKQYINFLKQRPLFDTALRELASLVSSLSQQTIKVHHNKRNEYPPSISSSLIEQTGIIATYDNLNSCKSDLVDDFKNATNVKLLLQLGRNEIGTGINSFFFPIVKSRAHRPNCTIKILRASVDSPFLSEKRARIRQKISERDWRDIITEWRDTIKEFDAKITLMRKNVNITVREHSEPFLWRIFIFDKTAYVSGYLFDRYNDNRAIIHKFAESEYSLFAIFEKYFDYLWKKYDLEDTDDPDEKWSTWS